MLKRIFQLKSHFEINERSWVRSLAPSFSLLAMPKKGVSTAISFMLLFNMSVISLTYIRNRGGPNQERPQ